MYEIVTDYVFPAKAKAILNQENLFQKSEKCNTYSFPNATVLPAKKTENCSASQGCGGVADSNGNYIEISRTKARVDGKYDFCESEIVKSCDETVVFCGYFHKVWGHFITESVSRLWYALEHHTEIDRYVFIGDYGSDVSFSGNYLLFLKLLGLAEKVTVITLPTKFKKVIIPDHGFVYNEYYTDQYVRMYDYINAKGLALYQGKTYERVFFSKRLIDSSIISNINEKVLDEFFKKNGYEIFYPEKLTLVETIGILQNAKFFAGQTSSLSHNLLFANQNVTMISLEKQAFHNPYQVFVGKIKNCKTIYIDACRHLFPVCSAGPFLFDYTEKLDKFAKDYNLAPSKSMSKVQYRRNLKKYFISYFDLNNKMPPDYMYRQYVIDMAREMYDDTVSTSDVFKISVFRRVILKLKKVYLYVKRHFF